MVTESGDLITPKKIDAILNWPVPKNNSKLYSFLGFAVTTGISLLTLQEYQNVCLECQMVNVEFQ